MNRRLAVAVGLAAVLAVVVAGCGGAHDHSSATHLTLLAVNPQVGRAVFHLSCRPAGGDVPAPARACAALARSPGIVESPKPFVCHGPGWWDVAISGRLDGTPLRRHVSTCWTQQMRLIGALGIARSLVAHLQPRRKTTLLSGEAHTFPSGRLRPGDEVVCRGHGRTIKGGVPIAFGAEAEAGYDGVGVKPLELKITRHRDGSVSASCT